MDPQRHGNIREETKGNLLEVAPLGIAKSEVHVWEVGEEEDDAS